MDPHLAQGEGSSQEDVYQCSQKHLLGTGSFSQGLFGSEGFESQEFNVLFEGIQDTSLLSQETDSGAGYRNPIFGTDAMIQNIIASQGVLSQNSFGINIPLDTGDNDSFGQFPNNSFDLTNMEGAVTELSQRDEFDVSVLNNVTPPLSGSENGADLHDNRGLNGVKLQSVKCETGTGLQAGRGGYEELLRGSQASVENDDSATAESSQDESQGVRLPVLRRFLGKYGFRMRPAEQIIAKKCQFDPETNKIFCVDKLPVLFEVILDFPTAPLKKLSVDTVVYYTENNMISKNVEQCGNCIDAEVEKLPPTQNADPTGTNTQGHVIRCDNPRAEYFKKRGLHNCVSVPLEKLQPGADRILRNYTFLCMNSCHAKRGRDCKAWTVVFYLMEGDREVGRDVYNIKVCKCPARDLSNERKARRQYKGNRAVKKAVSVKVEEGHRPPPAKHAKLSSELELAEGTRRAEFDNPRPGPSRQAGMPGPSNAVRQGSKQKDSQDTDSESFSQENSQNSGTNILATLTEYVKLALALRKHQNPLYRQQSKNWLRQLKCHENAMALNVALMVEDDLPNVEEEENEAGRGSQD